MAGALAAQVTERVDEELTDKGEGLMTRYVRSRAGALFVLATLTMAAACGGDDDSGTTTAGTTGAAETTATTGDAGATAETTVTTESADDPGTSGGTRLVDTAMGELEVPTDPQRIVVLWGATLSSVVQLGFEPVASMGQSGNDTFLVPYLPEGYPIDDLEVVAEPREVNFESVASVDPDLILGGDVPHLVDAYGRLSDIAPTALLTWDGTASWRTMLDDVAEVLGVPERAEEIADEYVTRLAETRTAIGLDTDPLTVTLVRIQTAEEVRIETPESFSGQILADVGFDRPESQDTPDDGADFISLSLERIPELDAPTIIATYYFDGDSATAWEQVQTSGLWQALPAVQAGDVVEVDFTHWGASNYYAAHRILDDLTDAFGS